MNKTALIMLLGATAISMQARQLTPDEALSRALNTVDQSSGQQTVARAAAQSPQLVYTAEMNSQPMAYVFTTTGDNGYIVVSANDIAAPVLGYSDDTAFSAENMPENMKAWLDGYAREIDYAAQHETQKTFPSLKTDRAARQDVSPLVTTRWDQSAPYWEQCPKYNGRNCYTGCVATAMAQIMNYHEWPETGQGDISYSWNNQTLSCDFSSITFEWDKMLDIYSATSPAENRNAVATLMKACGYGARMGYSPTGSGAQSIYATNALMTYFNYDASMSLQRREWYNIDEWDELVYNELTTNGPVYYDGSGTDGAHAFVCDGYRTSDGFFHFNWGWGGLSDGYFRLSALDPGAQGAGGNTTGFNVSQSIMTNFRKAQTNSEPTYVIYGNYGFTTSNTSSYIGSTITFAPVEQGQGTGFFNFSPNVMDNVSFGIQCVNTETKDVSYMESSTYRYLKLNIMTGFSTYNVRLTALASGKYLVSPVFKVGASGQWQLMKTDPSFNNSLYMTVNGSAVQFSEVGANADLLVSDIQFLNQFTNKGPFNIKAKITNRGIHDFVGMICGGFHTGQEASAVTDPIMVSLKAGESKDLEYTGNIVDGSLNGGKYYFVFVNVTSGAEISEPIIVDIIEPDPEPVMTCAKFVIGNSTSVDCNSVKARATITCSQLGYTGPIAFLAFESSDLQNYVGMFQTEDMTFEVGDSRSVTVSGIFQEGQPGVTYTGILAYRGNDGSYKQIGTSTVKFKVAVASGIDDVEAATTELRLYPNPVETTANLDAPADIANVTVYSISGTQQQATAYINARHATVDVSALTAGTYIVAVTCTDGSRHTAKLIKR